MPDESRGQRTILNPLAKFLESPLVVSRCPLEITSSLDQAAQELQSLHKLGLLHDLQNGNRRGVV
jgi:hypothetical protein